MLLFSQNLFVNHVVCRSCDNEVSVSNLDVVPANILFIEFSPHIQDTVNVLDEIIVNGLHYKLKSVVRNSGLHFTVAVSSNGEWKYIDDLKYGVECFDNFSTICRLYRDGCFFLLLHDL